MISRPAAADHHRVETVRADTEAARPPAPTPADAAALYDALRAGDPVMVVQPIIDLATGDLTSYEALARFPHLPGTTPDRVFAQAARSGSGADLEALAVLKALEIPGRPPGVRLSFNLSPSALLSSPLADVLPADLTGLQVEITEHENVSDLPAFLLALDALRARGARIAVDDVGEGYSGLQRVMALEPEVLKLDRSIVSGVRHGTAKAALVESIVRYAGQTGALVCAEGIETPHELAVLADLDVARGQGWFIGRPEREYTQPSAASRDVCGVAMREAVTNAGVTGGAGDRLVPLLARLASATSLVDLGQVLAQLAPVVGATSADLSYVDEASTYVESVLPDTTGRGVRYYLDGLPLTRQVLDEDMAAQVVIGSADADPAEVEWMENDGVGSLLMVPVRSARGVVGLLEFEQRARAPWRRQQIRDARTVAAVAGPVLTTLLARAAS